MPLANLLDRRAMLAMTATPSLRAQRSNPVNRTTGAADVAIQPPLSNNAFGQSAGSPRYARDDSHPVIASAAKQSSQSNNRRSRRGNSDAFIQQCLWPNALLICWIAALCSR